jgi:flagellar assembly protein FliH
VYKVSQVNMGHPYAIMEDKEIEFLKDDETKKEKEYNLQHESEDEDFEVPSSEDLLEEIKDEANLIMEKAEKQAQERIKKAMEESLMIQQEAEKKGFELGFEKGNIEGATQYEKITKEAEFLFADLSHQYENLLLKAENELVRLSIEIAKKVVGMELTTNPKLIVALTRDALTRTLQQEGIVVKVSQEDAQVLSDHLALLGEGQGRKRDIQIEESLRLKKGECLVQTDYGIVDGSLEKKMENIESALLKELESDKGVE